MTPSLKKNWEKKTKKKLGATMIIIVVKRLRPSIFVSFTLIQVSCSFLLQRKLNTSFKRNAHSFNFLLGCRTFNQLRRHDWSQKENNSKMLRGLMISMAECMNEDIYIQCIIYYIIRVHPLLNYIHHHGSYVTDGASWIFSSSSFAIRLNLLHPQPSLFLFGLLSPL